MIAAPTLSAAEHPKQVKLLGATVAGLGTITAVSQRLTWGYALAEDQAGRTHHVFLADLKRDQVSFPAEIQPYRAATERIGIGTWDEVYSLVTTAAATLAVAA